MSNRFTKIVYARTFRQRLRGLIGITEVPDCLLLVFEGCRHVHTCFMRCAIDVLYLDADGLFLASETLAPWRLGHAPKGAYSVAECAAGAGAAFKRGDRIDFNEGQHALEEAFEAASCWFGLNAGTSCIGECWEDPRGWSFVSAAWGATGGMRTCCFVDKGTGRVRPGGHTAGKPLRPPDAIAVEVPWKYLARDASAA